MTSPTSVRTAGAGARVPQRPQPVPHPPRASVVIPALNEVRCLAPLLERLDRDVRSRHRLEVVISDGGSTDGSIELARALADAVVVHEGTERQTIAAGRNAGAAAARGRLLLFTNADVLFRDDLDGFLLRMLGEAEHHGAATCRVEVHPEAATMQDRLVLGGCNAVYRAWTGLGLGMGRGECQAVRRDVFDAVGGYNPRLVAGEDFDLYRRIATWGRTTGRARVRFVWDEVVWEDPRRYRKHGYVRTLASWLRNSAYVAFLGRAHSETWEPVR